MFARRTLPTQVNIPPSYVLTTAYNTRSQWMEPRLGLQICVRKCRSTSTLGNLIRTAWDRMVLTQEKSYSSSSLPPCVLCGKSVYTGKGTFSPFFFFVKWSKIPHGPVLSAHSGELFQSISYRMKHPFNKYVATRRLTPGDAQQANLANI